MAFYTISPTTPFLQSLAMYLQQQGADDPLLLSQTRIFLPTRRACKKLTSLLLDLAPTMVLPKIQSVSHWDKEALSFADPKTMAACDALNKSLTERRQWLLLLVLVKSFSDAEAFKSGASNTAQLTTNLKQVLDEMELEGGSFETLEQLVPDNYALNWQVTLNFLKILKNYWPEVLKAEHALPPIVYQQKLLALQLEAWRLSPPTYPVIAAGITGAIPLVGDLLQAISQLPCGTVILPGFDRAAALDISPAHPQYAMHEMLKRSGISPQDVKDFGPKNSLMAEALYGIFSAQPAPQPGLKNLFQKLAYCPCANEQEEAEIISIAIREVLENPDKTAALITPDRGLAKRVALCLKRWGIVVDDSAGTSYALLPEGIFLRLTAQLAQPNYTVSDLLSVLKHPSIAGPFDRFSFLLFIRHLEKYHLRSVPRISLDRILKKIAGGAVPPELTGFSDQEWLACQEYLRQAMILIEALQLAQKMGESLRDILVAHKELLQFLRHRTEEDSLFAEPDADANTGFSWEDLEQDTDGISLGMPRPYEHFLEAYLSPIMVQPEHYRQHPRVQILGCIESRLSENDCVILGGLNDHVWPGKSNRDGWLNESLRLKLGLPSASQKTGLIAHDFLMAFSGASVILTRALLDQGTPTIPSRFLSALEASGLKAGISLPHNQKIFAYYKEIITPKQGLQRLSAPKPMPPLQTRPRALSITDVGVLVRNPYVIYAKHILKLRPLEPLESTSYYRDFGIVLHEVFYRWLPILMEKGGAAEADGKAILEKTFYRYFWECPTKVYWYEKAWALCMWFAAEILPHRGNVKHNYLEVSGTLILQTAQGPFTIKGVADRIVEGQDQTVQIIDYKTGQMPSFKKVQWGEYPQLSLEGALYQFGHFDGIESKRPITDLTYWHLGAQGVGGAIISLKCDPSALIESARLGVTELVIAFEDIATPYAATIKTIAPAYDHLSRRKEWQYARFT